VFAVPDPPAPLADLLERVPAGVERITASHEALAAAGSLGSGSRVVGLWELPDLGTIEPVTRAGPVLYLHDVADPGNVGTILRAARAFGAPLVVLSERAADPFGPKAVRAGMGAIFGQRLARTELGATRTALGEHRAIALVPGAGAPLREAPLGGRVLFVLGAERSGLAPELVAECDLEAHVPVDREAAESLNVAMTATLCLYEYRARHG